MKMGNEEGVAVVEGWGQGLRFDSEAMIFACVWWLGLDSFQSDLSLINRRDHIDISVQHVECVDGKLVSPLRVEHDHERTSL